MSKTIYICHPWRGNGKLYKDTNYDISAGMQKDLELTRKLGKEITVFKKYPWE